MKLTNREKDKLLISLAAMVARSRRKKKLKLNCPECVAIISYYVVEGAREGKTVAQLMSEGTNIIKKSEVMEGVDDMIKEVQVEATFPDGTKLVTIHKPIR